MRSHILGCICLITLSLMSPMRTYGDSGISTAELKSLSLEELLNQKITSASKKSEKIFKVGAAAQVISGEEIRRSGATSIPEALRLATGVQVARISQREWAISVRGFNSTTANKLLVLIDGRSVYTPLFSGVFWDIQDVLLEDLDRIEVIRGPGTTLWGANAVNGVINIITKSAADSQGLFVAGGSGTQQRGFAEVRYGTKVAAGTHARVYGKYFDIDALSFADGSTAGDTRWMAQGGFRLDSRYKNANSLALQGDFYKSIIGQLNERDVDLKGGNLLARWKREFSQRADLQVQVYYDRTRRQLPPFFAETRDTYDLDIQHRFNYGARQEIIWGLGYRTSNDDVENSVVIVWEPARLNTDLVSGFVQDEIVLLKERLHLMLGSKFEHNDFSGFEIQPSARLVWWRTDRQTLWAAVSRAVRTPTRIDRDIRILTPEGVELFRGNKQFDSEKVVVYEMGGRVQPRDDLSLMLSTFYNQYGDLRSQEPAPPNGVPFVLDNKLRGETYGLEAETTHYWREWWRWYGSYSYLHKELRLAADSNDPSGGRTEGNDPEHQFSLRSSLDFRKQLEFDMTIRFVSRLPEPPVSSYTALDMRVGYRASAHWLLEIVGRNLLAGKHSEYGTIEERREIADSVYGKITWRY